MNTSARCKKLMGFFWAALLLSPLTIADEDVKSLTATCAACHGANGISAADSWPNLAGQQRNYLATQIRAFRDGLRVEPTMQPMVQNLSDSQIDAIADHYASLPSGAAGATAAVNMDGKNVRALCVSCHGMSGNTVSSDWPNLAGQKAGYLQKTMLDIKAGKRVSPVMTVILEQLDEQQIKDVAEYYSQL